MSVNVKSIFKLSFSQRKSESKNFCFRNCLLTVSLSLLLSFSLMAPVLAAGSEFVPVQIDVGSVSSDGAGYSFSDGVVTIFETGCYFIFGSTMSNCVRVAEDITVSVTLSNVVIDRQILGGACAFRVSEGAVVDLTLVGESVLKSGGGCAGLEVPYGSVLTINGSEFDSLTAIGGTYGAGIGGGWSETGGSITICGGSIVANGSGSGGAGIGGGLSGAGGNIEIKGGNIVATAFYASAGVGGGLGADGGCIVISGGNVTAIGGGNGGAGIGGGGGADGGCIVISGGNVTANSGWYGAGIGGGWHGAGGCIVISGGNVTATGDSGSAGIGGGISGASGSIVINGGNVTATGGDFAPGIGSGSSGTGGNILIYGEETVLTTKAARNWIPDIGAGADGVVDNVFVAIPYNNLTGFDDAKIGNTVLFSAKPTATGVISVTLPKPFTETPFNSGIITLLSGLGSEEDKVLSVITSLSLNSFNFVFEIDGCYPSVSKSGDYLNNENNAEITFIEQHNWSDWKITTSATCKNDGVETRVCTNNDKHIENRPLTALGHNWDNGIVTLKPTDISMGIITFTCTHCSDTYTEDIPLLEKTLTRVTPSAFVTKINGNKNDLTITVTELFSNDLTHTITKTFSINNNAAGTYQVDHYKVYVDTKGNTQIRECYIIE